METLLLAQVTAHELQNIYILLDAHEFNEIEGQNTRNFETSLSKYS